MYIHIDQTSVLSVRPSLCFKFEEIIVNGTSDDNHIIKVHLTKLYLVRWFPVLFVIIIYCKS